jgi:L-fuculose-phosphate aldolase
VSFAGWAEVYLPQFQTAGRTLANRGLISGSSGNLSVRLQERIVITRHGSLLSDLTLEDLIETSLEPDDGATHMASWELPVHRAIYAGTTALAIVHAHPPNAVTLSLIDKMLELPGEISVVGANTGIVAGILAVEITREIKKHPLVMVKGHGSFAIGRTLAKACRLTSGFETSCASFCKQRSISVLIAGE